MKKILLTLTAAALMIGSYTVSDSGASAKTVRPQTIPSVRKVQAPGFTDPTGGGQAGGCCGDIVGPAPKG